MVLDGHVTGTQSLNATLALPGLTTTGISNIVYVWASMTGTGHSISNITDSQNRLTFSRVRLVNAANALGPSLDVWAATTTQALTNDVITITVSSAAFIWSAGAISWKGINQSQPFDINGPWFLNPTSGGGQPSVGGISTNNANNVIFAFMGNNADNVQTAGTSFILADTATQTGNSTAVEYSSVSNTLTNFVAQFGDAVPDSSAWTIIVSAAQKTTAPSNSNAPGAVGVGTTSTKLVKQIVSGKVGINASPSTVTDFKVGIGVKGKVALTQKVKGQVGISARIPAPASIGIGVSGTVLVEQLTKGSVGLGTAGLGIRQSPATGIIGIGVSGTVVAVPAFPGTVGVAVGQGGDITVPDAFIGTSVIGDFMSTHVVHSLPLVSVSQNVLGSVGIGSAGAPFASAQAAGVMGVGIHGTASISQAVVAGQVGIRGFPTNIDVTNPTPPVILREIFPVKVTPYRHGLMMVTFNPSDFSDKQDNFGSLSEYPFYQMGIAALPNSIVNHTLVLPKIEFYQGGGIRYYYNPATNEIQTHSLNVNSPPPAPPPVSATVFGSIGLSALATPHVVITSVLGHVGIGIHATTKVFTPNHVHVFGSIGLSSKVTAIQTATIITITSSPNIAVAGNAIAYSPTSASASGSVGISDRATSVNTAGPTSATTSGAAGIGIQGTAVSSGGGGGGSNNIVGTAIVDTAKAG